MTKGSEKTRATSPGGRWCVTGGGWSVLGMVGALVDGAVYGGDGCGEQPGVVAGRQPGVGAGGDDKIVCAPARRAGEVLPAQAKSLAEAALESVAGMGRAEAAAYGKPEAVLGPVGGPGMNHDRAGGLGKLVVEDRLEVFGAAHAVAAAEGQGHRSARGSAGARSPGKNAVKDADGSEGNHPKPGVAVGHEPGKDGAVLGLRRQDGGRRFELTEDRSGPVTGQAGGGDGLGPVGQDVKLGSGKAFENGRAPVLYGIKVMLVAFETLAVSGFICKSRVAAPAGIGQIPLGRDEHRGSQQREPGDKKQVPRVERSKQRALGSRGAGHVLYLSAGQAGLLDRCYLVGFEGSGP